MVSVLTVFDFFLIFNYNDCTHSTPKAFTDSVTFPLLLPSFYLFKWFEMDSLCPPCLLVFPQASLLDRHQKSSLS